MNSYQFYIKFRKIFVNLRKNDITENKNFTRIEETTWQNFKSKTRESRPGSIWNSQKNSTTLIRRCNQNFSTTNASKNSFDHILTHEYSIAVYFIYLFININVYIGDDVKFPIQNLLFNYNCSIFIIRPRVVCLKQLSRWIRGNSIGPCPALVRAIKEGA